MLLAILPALAVILYTGWERRQRVSAQAQAESLQVAHLFASKQADEMQATRRLLFTLAQMLATEGDHSTACRALSSGGAREDWAYLSLDLLQLDGQVLCTTASTHLALSARDRDYFEQAVQSHAEVTGEYEIDPAGQAVLPFFQPILKDSQVTQVLRVTLGLGWFDSFASQTQLPSGSALTVIDKDDTILARAPNSEQWLGKTSLGTPLVQTVLAAKGDGATETTGLDGVTRLYGFTEFDPQTQASITVGIPSTVVFADEEGILARNLALMALAAGMALMAAWVFGDVFIVRPVDRFLQATRRLARGDLSTRTRMQHGTSELTQLGRAFDGMAQSLEAHEIEIRKLNTELEQRVAERTAQLEAANRAKDTANTSLMHRANELEQRAREMLLLNEMGDLLESCLSEQEAYQVIAQAAMRLFPDDSGALYVITNSRNLVEAVALWGEMSGNGLERVFALAECWALRRGKPHSVDNTDTEVVCEHVKRAAPSDRLPFSYLCIPMIAQSEMLGVFHWTSRAQGALTESKRRLAVSVAEHIALALSSLRLRETLREQAIRDSLTGLFNRRYMTESLERELRRAERRRSAVGIIMLDLDHFKHVNDTYGHDIGDMLLRAVGHLLQKQIREEDIACRYGGEEFTVILPDTRLDEVRLRSEQLRVAVTHIRGGQNGAYADLSASFGIAEFPAHGSTADAVLHAADAALYEAKTNGRDQVVVAPLSGTPQIESVA